MKNSRLHTPMRRRLLDLEMATESAVAILLKANALYQPALSKIFTLKGHTLQLVMCKRAGELRGMIDQRLA